MKLPFACGGFALVDSVRGSFEGGERDTLPGHPIVPASIVGKISGDQMTITLQLNYGSSAVADSIAVSGIRGQSEAEQFCRS
jgi:hypothetical protein